jgi:spore germination cell wall hydrolase CwlJ-like protein
MRWLAVMVAALCLAGEGRAQPIGDRDLECLAHNVFMEARDQPYAGRLAVAHVTLNRLRAGFARTVCAVVHQPGAFSWTGRQPQHGPIGLADLRAWDWAKYVAMQAVLDPDGDPTGGATHFHSRRVEPEWRNSLVRLVGIGEHVFYRE